jgi:transposase
VFGDSVELHVPRLRLACSACGPRLDSVARLCAVTSVCHAARWHGVEAIDLRSLERRLGPVELDGVRLLAMDEFAIQKGHRYATVEVDVERKRVLWVGRGSSPGRGERLLRAARLPALCRHPDCGDEY